MSKSINILIICSCLAAITFSSCATTNIPLVGNYYSDQTEIISNKNKEKVWDNIVEFCAQQGLSIKVIDKASGLISFDKLGAKWTFELEDKSGNLEDSTAWVAVTKRIFKSVPRQIQRPSSLSVEWSIRLKDLQDGKIQVTTNLIYVKDTGVYSTKYDKYVNENVLQSFSTGVMEKMLEQKINN
jgi:hypothetical protein